jgi:hypothetical protein
MAISISVCGYEGDVVDGNYHDFVCFVGHISSEMRASAREAYDVTEKKM